MTEKDVEKSPSLEAWRALYEAAIEFKNLAPWEWMWDSDLFGVQNPRDNEIGYCCVLGGGRELFGFVVYLGTEGLEEYLKHSKKPEAGDHDDALHDQRCLILTFDDKKDLQDPDFDVIKSIGLDFSGKNSWPSFRSYRSGYLPWYLTADEAEFLTLCLRQSIGVAGCFKGDPELFSSPDDESYFVNVQDKSKSWKNAWLKPAAPLRKMVMMVKSIDEERFKNVKAQCTQKRQTWEIDYFYAPAHIAEKGKRPYFPITLLFADRHSYFILNAHVSDHDTFRAEFFEELFKTFEKHKIIPEEIAVRKDEFLLYLKPFSERLGIKVSLEKSLRAVDDARKSMFEHFRKPIPAQEVRGEKIGRNEPCPCGSGKKYKKCCGK